MFTDAGKKTKFGNNLPKLMLVELPEPSATCERDVVPAGTALCDNGHEPRNAAITSWRGQSTKIIIFIQTTT